MKSINDENDYEQQQLTPESPPEDESNNSPIPTGRLSTIPEEDEADSELWLTGTMAKYFAGHDPTLDEHLIEACLALHNDTEIVPNGPHARHAGNGQKDDLDDFTRATYTTLTVPTPLPPDVTEYHIYLQAGIPIHFYGLLDSDEHGEHIDIDFHRNCCRALMDDTNMASHEIATMRIYATAAKGPKKSIIDRDTDLLSKEELDNNKT